ncbi:hypothetical protein [Streptomyces actuosus]|uniref:hypothetical protein n=1 Tax=Streptomyces actuosus TaxID=1885 RepID=UPI001F054532
MAPKRIWCALTCVILAAAVGCGQQRADPGGGATGDPIGAGLVADLQRSGGRNAIDFLTAFRYALPDPGQEQAANAWRQKPPLTVMRVRAPASAGPVERYGPLTFGARTADSEASLAGDMRNLIGAVCDRVRGTAHLRTEDCTQPLPESTRMIDPVEEYGWTGPYCRSINMDCLGDQQDAAYFLSQRALPLDSGQVYAVVDTLATETGNATYSALSVNDAALLAGVANVLDTDLKGSADGYAKSVGHSDKFFVYYFTRDCGVLRGVPGWPKNCTAITTQMLPPKGDTSAEGDPALLGTFVAGLRDYVKPGTERGPDPAELLAPRILTFTQQAKERRPVPGQCRPGGAAGPARREDRPRSGRRCPEQRRVTGPSARAVATVHDPCHVAVEVWKKEAWSRVLIRNSWGSRPGRSGRAGRRSSRGRCAADAGAGGRSGWFRRRVRLGRGLGAAGAGCA